MSINVQNAGRSLKNHWAAIADYARAGAIIVLHPFARDLGFNLHIHLIITEGGSDRSGKFVHKKFIDGDEFARL